MSSYYSCYLLVVVSSCHHTDGRLASFAACQLPRESITLSQAFTEKGLATTASAQTYPSNVAAIHRLLDSGLSALLPALSAEGLQSDLESCLLESSTLPQSQPQPPSPASPTASYSLRRRSSGRRPESRVYRIGRQDRPSRSTPASSASVREHHH